MNLFENLQIYNESMNSVVQKIATQVRDEIVDKYGADNLYGKCIEASDKIKELLDKEGIDSHTVEGWCIYSEDASCSDRPYDEHTWVELNDGTYIDVTATQFQSFVDEEIPDIIIGDMPNYMTYEEPEVDEDGYIIGRDY